MIKVLATDIDGVLTDGKGYVLQNPFPQAFNRAEPLLYRSPGGVSQNGKV